MKILLIKILWVLVQTNKIGIMVMEMIVKILEMETFNNNKVKKENKKPVEKLMTMYLFFHLKNKNKSKNNHNNQIFLWNNQMHPVLICKIISIHNNQENKLNKKNKKFYIKLKEWRKEEFLFQEVFLWRAVFKIWRMNYKELNGIWK